MRTEEDIRAAYESVARQAPDAAPVLAAVRDHANAASRPRARRGRQLLALRDSRSRWRLLAPVTAAAAVIAVVGSLIAVGSIGGPASRSGAAAANAPGPDGAPRYYLVLTQRREGQPLSEFRAHALLRDTASGALLARVAPPAGFNSIAAVAGAANDRTFVLAVQRKLAPGGRPPTTFFRAQFDPERRAVTLTRLPIPVMRGNEPIDGLALSPDGTMLAVATRVPREELREQISVYSMATGAVRVWQQRSPSLIRTLSFDRAGQLAYIMQSGQIGIWLLDTATPGGGLIADSRLAVGLPNDVAFFDGVVLLTGDGRTAVGAEIRESHASLRTEIAEYSTATGRQTRSLLPAHDGLDQVAWTNPSGTTLIVVGPGKRGFVLGVLSGKRLTPIPDPSGIGSIDPTAVAF
jgi:hypothetical protein